MNVDQPTNPARRRGLVLGMGTAALLAGAAAAWWSGRSSRPMDPAAAALWALSATQPDGAPLAMASLRGRPTLVNFWATWCPPCVEELPLIDAFYREHAANGWQVVGLAVDKPAAVQAFLGKTPVTFPVGILGLGGMSMLKTLGNTGGGLPFTLVLNAEGALQDRKMGQITTIDLLGWARETTRS